MTQLVPAHVRDLQRRIGGSDARDLAADPAQARRGRRARGRVGQELHADADAEERPPLLEDGAAQRLDHARHGVEPAPAVGEGADAGQHDVVGAQDVRGVGGDLDLGVEAGLADGPLERLGRRAQVARAVVDDGDAHRASSAASSGWRSKKRRSAASAPSPVTISLST